MAPALVIHCAGPFQRQGYEVVRTALACGAHYIDPSDGRDFVAGFAAAINDDAVRASRLAVTGTSTLPALSSAVVEGIDIPSSRCRWRAWPHSWFVLGIPAFACVVALVFMMVAKPLPVV